MWDTAPTQDITRMVPRKLLFYNEAENWSLLESFAPSWIPPKLDASVYSVHIHPAARNERERSLYTEVAWQGSPRLPVQLLALDGHRSNKTPGWTLSGQDTLLSYLLLRHGSGNARWPNISMGQTTGAPSLCSSVTTGNSKSCPRWKH